MSILRQEPALVGGVAAGAGILVAAVFLSPVQIAAVVPLIPVVAAVFVRRQVYSKPTMSALLSANPPGAPPPK